MGDFEQSLRDQFGSERNQRIAVLKTTVNLLRARLEAAEQIIDEINTALREFVSPSDDRRFQLTPEEEKRVYQRSIVDDIRVFGNHRNGERETLRKAEAELATERTARRDAEAELARIDKAMDDVDLPTDQDDFRLTRAGRLAALKDWWQDYAECTQKAISRAEEAEAQVVALREVLKWYSSAQRYKLRKEVHSAYGRSWDVPVISEIDADQGKRARNAFSRSSPAAERIKALEEEHKLALTLCQRIDETVGDVKDFAGCVDRQHAAYEAWRTVVEKVGEE